VAVIAIIVSHGETRGALKHARYATSQQLAASTAQIKEMIAQVQALRDQLAESKRQRVFFIAQTQANLSRSISMTPIFEPEGTTNIARWALSPIYINSGSTDAEDLQAWFDIKTSIRAGRSTSVRR
jgi:hypothetical protein